MTGNKSEHNIDSTNIFDEFSHDEKLKNEVKNTETKKKRGDYHYLGITNSFLTFVNLTFFIVFVLAFAYIQIQKSEDMYESKYLDPLCGVFLHDGPYEELYCSSASAMLKQYKDKKGKLTKQYYSEILGSIGDVYSISNFIFSKEVLFLIDRTRGRLQPLTILEDFDKLKNAFEPTIKSKIHCFDMEITDGSSLKMTCEAYSSRWDRNIIGPSGGTEGGDKVEGTSISLASSFVNYLEKTGSNFTIINKPKKFSYQQVFGIGGYTRKTVFDLDLQVNTPNISLLK